MYNYKLSAIIELHKINLISKQKLKSSEDVYSLKSGKSICTFLGQLQSRSADG